MSAETRHPLAGETSPESPPVNVPMLVNMKTTKEAR